MLPQVQRRVYPHPPRVACHAEKARGLHTLDYQAGSLVDYSLGRVLVTSEHPPSHLPFRETLQIQSYGDDFLQAAAFQQTSGLREVSDHLLSNNGSSPKQRLCQLSGVLKIAWYLLKVCLDIKVPLWLGNRVLPCSLSPKLLQMCPWRDFCMHYYLKTPRVSDPFA